MMKPIKAQIRDKNIEMAKGKEGLEKARKNLLKIAQEHNMKITEHYLKLKLKEYG